MIMSNHKALGLTLTAVLAICAFLASAAAAAEFHDEKAGAALVGEGEGEAIFGTETGEMKCKKLTSSGTYGESTTVSAFELAPTLSECTTALGNATVHMNKCTYKPAANQTFHIICPVGKLIEITAPGCTVTWPPQTIAASITYTNIGAGKGRKLKVQVSTNLGVYEEHGFACKNPTKLKSNGKINFSTTVKAESEGGEVGLWWE
jgi:hypothetical protein